LKSPGDTYHQSMGVDMRLEVVDFGLLVMAQISDAKGQGASDIPVE
jgi:hypothetical protein